MSSPAERVVARAVQPGDRNVWDQLFRAYREFYKLAHDERVRVGYMISDSFFCMYCMAFSDALVRFTTLFGVG